MLRPFYKKTGDSLDNFSMQMTISMSLNIEIIIPSRPTPAAPLRWIENRKMSHKNV